MSRTVLVTGAAGFIGAALTIRLLQRGDRVVGLDNLNDYYDPTLKQARLRQIEAVAPSGAWRFERLALEDVINDVANCSGIRETSVSRQGIQKHF